VLQAADVLLYKAHGVPVGEDQRQHIELMRDLAVRFNQLLGDVLVLPEALIPPVGARVMALDDPTQKMSKSAARPASSIQLTDPPDAVRKKIKGAVTDSGTEVRAAPDKPALTNLLGIFSLVTGTPVADLETRFESSGYGDFKSALADAVVDALAPISERYQALVNDPDELQRMLARGAERASEVAGDTMAEVAAAVGLQREKPSRIPRRG
jgi:tryptophanyl-tRNA synthetase